MIKEWELPLLRELLNSDVEMTSAEALAFLSGAGESKSRASVIGTLNRFTGMGILKFREETAQGGVRRIYSRNVDVEEFLKLIRAYQREAFLDLSQSLQGKVN